MSDGVKHYTDMDVSSKQHAHTYDFIVKTKTES